MTASLVRLAELANEARGRLIDPQFHATFDPATVAALIAVARAAQEFVSCGDDAPAHWIAARLDALTDALAALEGGA